MAAKPLPLLSDVWKRPKGITWPEGKPITCLAGRQAGTHLVQTPLRSRSREIYLVFCFVLMIIQQGSKQYIPVAQIKNKWQIFYPPFHGLSFTLVPVSFKWPTPRILCSESKVKFYSHLYKVSELLLWTLPSSWSKHPS